MLVYGLMFALQAGAAPAAPAAPADPAVIDIPRIDATATVDGALDEPVWADAAVIDGFMQYEPSDGRPATQRTTVRVWYAPDAIWFGIVAHDADPGSIRATRADRDAISGDDHVIIYLDTFRDRRRAFFFGANPLGVQQDGVRTEGAPTAGRMFGRDTDTSPDFVWQSGGRVTADGYVLELRVPFSSLRFPADREMAWGLNIERKTQRTGYLDTWPAVSRSNASFLAQGGTLAGLHDLRRGIVFEAQPVLTVAAPGARTEFGFDRADPDPELGVNLHAGLSNYALDATINPDFSQVEADAAQVTVNERFSLFLPEKRPFFLEGIELFSTPNQLVYTRRIVDPIAGAKVTGKSGALNVALMGAVDSNVNGDEALFNVARIRRDIGTSSTAGVTLTDRSILGGSGFNRVAAADARFVFGGMYAAEAQLGASSTRTDGQTRSGPIGRLALDRTGRAWGFNLSVNAVGDDFRTHTGFVNRSDIVTLRAFNRLTWFGSGDGVLERITAFFGPSRIWQYSDLGSGPIEGGEFVRAMFRMRGDWELAARVGRDYVQLDPQSFARFRTGVGDNVLLYTPLDRVSGPGFELSTRTPTYQRFDAAASIGSGRVAIFDEGSAGDARSATLTLNARPHEAVRVGLATAYRRILRERDGSEFARTVLPRVHVEVQPTRAFFVRAIAEYAAERRDALRDARTGAPLQVDGVVIGPRSIDGLRLDLLAAYEPTPGTVAFLGYGVSLRDRDAFAFDALRRDVDGLFLKLAYRFRRASR